jgi:hypothetical protein
MPLNRVRVQPLRSDVLPSCAVSACETPFTRTVTTPLPSLPPTTVPSAFTARYVPAPSSVYVVPVQRTAFEPPMFDEADIYLPATSKPPTKTPLESLLKRERSAGISVVLATQSPGDLDYKCRENVRNWFVGLVKETRALEKLKPLLSEAKLDATAVLPKQKVGQFFLLSENAAVPVQGQRNLVETQQLAEPEILKLASHQRWRS